MERKAPRPASPDAILLRPEEAAHALNVGRARVYALISSGQLRSLKIGGSRRVPRSAITEYIQRLTAEQSPERSA